MKGKRLLALLLCLLLLSLSAVPAALAEEPEESAGPEEQTEEAAAPGEEEEKLPRRTVHISGREDLEQLASDCKLDSYSLDLLVILDADLDLQEEPIYPIPTFGGVFDGGGHSINGLRLVTDGSHQGLFRYIQETGVVRNLRLSGSIAPANGCCQLGGLAGDNRGSVRDCSFDGSVTGTNDIGGLIGHNYGTIRNCSVSGSVSGKRMTGGIVGYNEGLVAECSSEASVNTTLSEGALQLEDLRVGSLSAADLTNAEDEEVVSDSGGIAGFSDGVLQDCVNTGVVGYPHFGYNVGGIAGRQAGFITGCENHGAVFGRKDVGGIVGQMEPFLVLKESVNLLEELVILNEKLNLASGTLGIMSSEMNGAMGDISASSNSAADKFTGEGTIEEPVYGGDDDGGGDEGGDIGPTSAGSIALSDGDASDRAFQNGVNRVAIHPKNGISDIDVPEGLEEDISGLANGLSEMFGIIATNTGELSTELTDANNQLSRVLMLMANAMNGGANRQIFEDISDELGEEDLEGRVSRCVNYAPVEGDKNVGGLFGDMGIEYEFDMEGNLAEVIGIEGIVSNTYETKCVSSDNVNRGTVKGRREAIGGITGNQELGSILRCENYGSADSSDGGYVGGVVGCSYSVVRQSYAMCNLSGQEYVGGIAGYGTTIQDCISMVGMTDVTACSGAVAGWAEMDGEAVSGNAFVHASLGGVDGISYSGRAYPLSYQQLLRQEGLPDQFRRLHLTFVADGVVVREVEFEYGGSISLRQIPPVPEKEGCTGSWPDYDYTALYYSAIIEAVYTPREGALAAKPTRGDSPMPIVLIEGDFDRNTEVLLVPYNGEGPQREDGTILESWTVRLTDLEEDQSYSLRYLPPELEKGHSVEIYGLRDGEWTLVEPEQAGSYLSFTCSERMLSFSTVDVKQNDNRLYLGIGISAAVVLVLALVMLGGRKKKTPAAAESKEK